MKSGSHLGLCNRFTDHLIGWLFFFNLVPSSVRVLALHFPGYFPVEESRGQPNRGGLYFHRHSEFLVQLFIYSPSGSSKAEHWAFTQWKISKPLTNRLKQSWDWLNIHTFVSTWELQVWVAMQASTDSLGLENSFFLPPFSFASKTPV